MKWASAWRTRAKEWTRKRRRRIFERFFRAEGKSTVAGTGLGMSIVKEILDIHGGRIDIVSAPGVGTAVTLWLPRAAPRG